MKTILSTWLAVLLIVSGVPAVYAGKSKSEYRLFAHKTCPLSDVEPKKIAIETADYPKTTKSPPKEMSVVATTLAVNLVATVAKSFLDNLLKENNKIVNGKKVSVKTTGLQVENLYRLDLNGKIFSPFMSSCLVLIESEFYDEDTYNPEKPPIIKCFNGLPSEKCFWNIKGSNHFQAAIKDWKLVRRPRFYAEFLPKLSSDKNSLKFVPKTVFYYNPISFPTPRSIKKQKANKEGLITSPTFDVSIELVGAKEKKHLINSMHFPKPVLGNIDSPKIRKTINRGDFKYSDARHYSDMIQPNSSTTQNAGELKSSWKKITKFLVKVSKDWSGDVSDKERSDHALLPMDKKNEKFAQKALAVLKDENSDLIKSLDLKVSTAEDDLKKARKDIIPKRDQKEALIKMLEAKVARYKKTINPSLKIADDDEALQDAYMRISNLTRAVLAHNANLSDKRSAVEKTIGLKKEAKEIKTELKKILEVKRNYDPIAIHVTITESRSTSPFVSLIRKWLKSQKDELVNETVNRAFGVRNIEKEIEFAEARKEIEFKARELVDKKSAHNIAVKEGKDAAEIRELETAYLLAERELEILKLELLGLK